MSEAVEYFNGNALAANVWSNKYALKDDEAYPIEDTPDEMHSRMAKEFSRITDNYEWDHNAQGLSDYGQSRDVLTKQNVYSYFQNFKHIIPQGSIMAGLGNPYYITSLSNCVVIDDVVDSYGGIMYTDQQLAQLMKRRCGVGVDISNLRPKGARTQNAAKTSTGTVSFAKRFSRTTNEVAQEGRRGALMLTLDCRHPEVLEFISSKADNTSITGANISVKWTEDFMDAVRNRESYTLRYPVDASVEEATHTKEVNAHEVFEQAAMYAHGYDQDQEENSTEFGGDPGCMFIDNMKSYSTDCGYPNVTVLSTNPCQPGYSTLRTPDGIKRMDDIKEGDIVWSEDGWVNVVNKVATGVKSVYKYETTAGSFHSTEDHRIKEHGEKIEIKDADEIDLLAGPIDISDYNIQSVVDGLMLGDGSYHEQSADPFYLNVGENDQDYFDDPVSELLGDTHAAHHDRSNKVKTTLSKGDLCELWNRRVPSTYFYGDPIDVVSFLRGLYSANGSICGKRVTLKTTSRELVEQVQEMLSSVGIRSYFTTNKATTVQHHNGEYTSKESYDVNITTDRDKFLSRIGFIQNYKMDKLKKIIENTKSRDRRKSHEIINVEYVGEQMVWDITVDGDSHTYWTHGFNSSNCGEIGMDVDSCRLIALNFMGVVENPFTDNAYVDYDKLYEVAYEQQVLLDNLVDLEIEKIDRILEKIENDPEASKYKRIEYETWQDLKDSAKKYRRTGGGFTALGDLLAAIGVEYGTPEANEVVDKLMSTKLQGEWDASIDLSIQRGSFPEWDDQYDSTEFFDMLAQEFPEIYARNNKYGRRNISLSTVAPTGSVSLLANINGEYGTTSGIEPVFSTTENKPWHTRRRRITEDEDLEPEGVDDSGFPYVTYNVFHEGFKQWVEEQMHENGTHDSVEDIPDEKLKDLAKLSPYVTSAGLNYRQRIKLQSIVQKYTTHSISSTLNLPEDSNWRETLDIYKTAYAEDLKGVTIFRNGSKQGVLGDSDNSSDNEGRGNEITYHDAPERPDKLNADLYHVRGQYVIAVGLLNDKPYEVFVLETSREQDYDEHFQIYKRGSRTYNLISTDSAQYIENILQYSPSSDADVLTRFTSQLMRHGVKMDYIVEQVRKADISINDFSNILAGVLEQYTSEEYTLTCENCGSENIKYVEGCATCQDCGASKCS